MHVNAQQLVEITGIVLQQDSLTPLNGAAVYNKNSFLGTLTNKIGNFKMRVKPGDTLQITHLGYITYLLIFDEAEIPKEKIYVSMKIKSYELEGVSVRAYRIREKKAKEQSMRRTDNQTIDMGPIHISGGPYYPGSGFYNPFGGMSIGVPIGSFREARRQAQYEKIAKLIEKDKLKKFVNIKYNKKLVYQLTGLTGNDLENFMNYCKPDDKMVLQANDYDLAYFVLDCYDRWHQDNGE